MWQTINWRMDEIASRLLPILIDTAIKATVILVLAYLAAWLMRRWSPAARHMIWLLATVSLAALPVLTVMVPGWQVLPQWMNPRQIVIRQVETLPLKEAAPVAVPARDDNVLSTVPQIEADPMPAAHAASVDRSVASGSGSAVPAVARPASHAAQSQPSHAVGAVSIACLVWVAGVAIVLTRTLLAMLSLILLGHAAQPVTDEEWIHALKQTCEDLGIRQTVRLLQSHRRPMPMVWGILARAC